MKDQKLIYTTGKIIVSLPRPLGTSETTRKVIFPRSMSNISQQSNLSITSNKSVTSTNSNYSVFSAARSERSETQSERLSDLMDTSDGSRCTQETQGPPRTPAQKDEDDPKRKLSGSEKKARLLKIVRAELEKLGMNTRHQNYKKCIKKLHEMCRMMLKVILFMIFVHDFHVFS